MDAAEHRYRLIAELVAGEKVVHVGCGRGSGTAILRRRAALVVAIDADPAAIAAATRLLATDGLSFEAGDPLERLEALQASDAGAVVCSLGRLDDPARAVRSLEGLASAGMKVFVTAASEALEHVSETTVLQLEAGLVRAAAPAPSAETTVEQLEQAHRTLRETNLRLARKHLGTFDSAAASQLARHAAEVEDLGERLAKAEARAAGYEHAAWENDQWLQEERQKNAHLRSLRHTMRGLVGGRDPSG